MYFNMYDLKKNNLQACKTSLNIADIMECKGASAEEIIVTYRSARCHAKDAKDMKLERSVLKTFIRYLRDIENFLLLGQ